MAPKLRCPECDFRHPLSEVAGQETFRCRECGRVLKVPESYRAAVDVVNSAETVAIAGGRVSARPMPSTGPGSKLIPPLHADAPEASLAPLSLWWRVLIWILAVPAGAVIGGLVANTLGLVTLSQLEDAFLESGIRRFAPLVRLVPIWALFVALIVHGAAALVDALRRRRAASKAAPRSSRDSDDADAPAEAPEPVSEPGQPDAASATASASDLLPGD